MLNAADRPLIVAGGGVISADASDLLVQFAEISNVPVVPTLMAWGVNPDDHVLMAGMAGLQTSHRYGNATMLESDFVLGIGIRWANRHTGSIETYTKERKFVHVDIDPEHAPRLPSLTAIPIEGDPVWRKVQLLAVAGRQYSPALDAFIKVARVRDWTSALDKLRRASAPASNKDNVRKADAQGAGSLI